MSNPASGLVRLPLIGDMSQRTRKEAQQERRRREAEQKRLFSEGAGASTIAPRPDSQGVFQGFRGLRYQVNQLQSPIQSTAIRGLNATNISAQLSRAHTDATGASYVAIQVVERLRLCIYPGRQEGRRIDCSCADFRNKNSVACVHIYVSSAQGEHDGLHTTCSNPYIVAV